MCPPRSSGAGSGVLSNQIQAEVGAGSTHNTMQTLMHTQVTSNLNQDMRTAMGGLDQQSIVSVSRVLPLCRPTQPVSTTPRGPDDGWRTQPALISPPPPCIARLQGAASGDYGDIHGATRAAHGNSVVTNRGDGNQVRDAGNRAGLATMDTSSAIQMVSSGDTANAAHATR